MHKIKRILLVEDDPGDQDLIKEILKDDKTIVLDTVGDGIEAMDFLNKKGAHQAAKRPDLIILDLNLPRKDGREVLAEVKNDENLKAIPIIILTTSRAENDIRTCYKLHASSYFIKPYKFQEITDMMHAIKNYWFGSVILSP